MSNSTSRTTMNLQDILNKIVHTNDHSVDLQNADVSSITGDRLAGKSAHAKGIAHMNDGSGIFTGKRTGAVDLDTRFEAISDYRKALDEAGGNGVYKRLADKAKRDLEKHGRNALRDATQGIEKINEVVALSHKQEDKAIKDILKKFERESRVLRDEIQRGGLSAEEAARALKEGTEYLSVNRKAALDAVREHFTNFRDDHKDLLEGLKTVIGDVEKETGLKAAEHAVKPSTVATLEREGAQAAESIAKKGWNITENLKGPAFAKGKAIVGLLGGGILTVSALNDLKGGTDEKGQPVEGNKLLALLKAAVGIGGGLYLAGHGGGRAR